MKNIKGSTALGVIGIIAMILIIDGVMIYFASALGNDINSKEFGLGDNECDCGTITCVEYQAIYGDEKLNQLCETQTHEGFTVDVITGFGDAPIIKYVIFISNVLLIIAGIIILRGGTG